jgi:O-antigen/teichoic acid export membrane protein
MSLKIDQPRGAKGTLIKGAAWTVGTRWTIKGMGFLNTVIVARLLLPADYGTVAMAMLLVGLIQALMDFGAATALLRKKEVSRPEIDSAWTLRLLQSLGMGLVLLVAAPFAASYFKEPRVEYVLWALAACVAFAGAANIGLVLALKEFNFSLEFRLQIISKLLGVLSTITAAYFLRDYRALVVGLATGYVSNTILSYVMHPYRPRWDISKITEIWAVTKWLMLAGVGGFILRRGDELIAARIGTTADFGLYNVGSDLGQMPTAEIGPAMLRALLPVLASMRDGVEEVNAAVIKIIGAVSTITFPIGLGFSALAMPATNLILGSAWAGAAEYVAMFAILSILMIIPSPFSTLLTVRGHTRIQSRVVWLEFVVFVVATVALVPYYYLPGLVFARILGACSNIVITFLAARRFCGVSLRATTTVLLRPLIGSCIMYLVVALAANYVDSYFLKILLGLACGVATYSTWIVLSWLVLGKPDGLESTAIDYARKVRIKDG